MGTKRGEWGGWEWGNGSVEMGRDGRLLFLVSHSCVPGILGKLAKGMRECKILYRTTGTRNVKE